MDDFGLTPQPAQWALDAGLPEPMKNEGFAQYVKRLGMDAGELLVDLTPRTIELANGRLESRLIRDMPDHWSDYWRTRYEACH